MKKSGFTLVEILIVVVILGILAVIVVPMFSDANQESRTAALKNDLQKIRGQIELYKFHHTDVLPVLTGESFSDFEQRMTEKTDNDGNDGSDFGPYLNRIPKNPFNDKNTVRIDGEEAGANTDGWRIDTTTGKFQADDSTDNAAL